jgi:hypothetical protein
VTRGLVQEPQPFEVVWRTIDGLKVRPATSGRGRDAFARPELFRSLIVGAGASTYPRAVEGSLKSMIEAEAPPPLNAVEVVGGFLASIRGSESYEGPHPALRRPSVAEDHSAAKIQRLEKAGCRGKGHWIKDRR